MFAEEESEPQITGRDLKSELQMESGPVGYAQPAYSGYAPPQQPPPPPAPGIPSIPKLSSICCSGAIQLRAPPAYVPPPSYAPTPVPLLRTRWQVALV